MQKLLTVALLLFSFQLFAQKTERPAFQFTVNTLGMGTGFNPFADGKVQPFAGTALSMLIPQKKEKYLALELAGFFNGEKDGNSRKNDFLLALRFEKGKYLASNPDSPFRFRLGGSLRYSYSKQDEISLATTRYPTDFWRHALELAFTPHLEYRAGKRFFFDIGPSISLLAFGLEKSQTNNPLLTKRQQERSGFVLDAGGLLLRLSAGFRL